MEDRASLTAGVVAFGRGVGVRDATADPTAPELLAAPLGALVRATNTGLPIGRALRALARAGSFGLVDHVTLRTAAIDRAVQRSVTRGCRQLVVLGAGLDGRAWRLDALADAAVFEVDHPATQRKKRDRVAALRPRAASVRFVGVDFERERISDRLQACGHDASRPTFWIWEGVTMYLDPAATAATLEDIARRSAAGSGLAMTYMHPEVTPPQLGRLSRLLFTAVGEPLIGHLTPREVAAMLEGAGFEVTADDDHRGWGDEGASTSLAIAFRAERLAIARSTTPTRALSDSAQLSKPAIVLRTTSGFAASLPISLARCSRARVRRERTVPSGTSSTSASSLVDSPSQ